MADETDTPEHELFRSLKTDVTNVHMYWQVYRQLYADGEPRIALLNETGSLVFYILQHLLLDEVTLAICRLSDPPNTGNKENHSLPRLAQSQAEVENLGEVLHVKLDNAIGMAGPFRQRRNRAIAHSDLATKLQLESDPLPGISREMIDELLAEVRDLMNHYEQHYFASTTFYEDAILPLGSDGNFLAEQLKRAVAFRDMERKGDLDRELWINGRYHDA